MNVEVCPTCGALPVDWVNNPFMTSGPTFEIRPAYIDDDKRDGFDLFINGQWHERFPTKREAKRAAKQAA